MQSKINKFISLEQCYPINEVNELIQSTCTHIFFCILLNYINFKVHNFHICVFRLCNNITKFSCKLFLNENVKKVVIINLLFKIYLNRRYFINSAFLAYILRLYNVIDWKMRLFYICNKFIKLFARIYNIINIKRENTYIYT